MFAMENAGQAGRSVAPPSVLPDISPTRGEIGCHPHLRQSSAFQNNCIRRGRPISPLVGEMSGRTEGGNVGRHARKEGEAR
ncbi:hypothetical protein MesoLjLb_02420 [Mesorhizobium sp. L-8-3]|nr:hypothetical protein MesoLjLb_02420 [Mesorhizobium sp. L-8-3]